MISDFIKNQLIEAGLSKQQATSATAEAVVNALMNKDEKTLLQEARLQVEEMSNIVETLRQQFAGLKHRFEELAGFLMDIVKAQQEHGEFTDERAKNTVALYAALLNMNERAGTRGKDSVENAGYVAYAYLGGQARRDIHYGLSRNNEDEDEDEDDTPSIKKRKRF